MIVFQKPRGKGTTAFVIFLLAAAGVSVSTGAVMAQTSAPAVAEDPVPAASRQAFEALPEAERKAIQDALIWVGVYNATSGGSFGRQTYAGINAYQKAAGAAVNGILSPELGARLKAEAASRRNAAGFKVVQDGKSGVEIGVPLTLLPKQSVNTFGGSRWQSADGKITLDTRVVAGGAEELQAQYERNIAAAPGRKITYKLQKPDFFVVSGETANGEFYVRYALGPKDLRGFTLGYDKSVKADFNRVMIAIANSFAPFPGDAAGVPNSALGSAKSVQTQRIGRDPADAADAPSTAFGSARAVQTRRIGRDGRPVADTAPAEQISAAASPSAAVPAPPMAAVPATAASVRATVDIAKVATGIRVGPRQVVTVGLTCKNPAVASAAAKIVRQDGDLALLEVPQDRVVTPFPLRAGPVPVGAGLVVVSWDASAKAAAVASGSGNEGEDLTAALQPGGRGGLVFDRNGAVVGIVGNARTPLRGISGVLTSASYAVVKVKTVQDFIGNDGGFAGEARETQAQSAGAIAATASSRIVDVTCP